MNAEQVYAPQQGDEFGDFAYEPQPQQAPQIMEQPKSKRTIVLKIYEDENGKKYIDASALTAMKGMEPSIHYTRPNGQVVSVPRRVLREKPADEIPRDFISSETVYPDFSEEYSFNEEVGMYEITDAQIAALIALYESMYPDIEVIVEIEKISSKKYNNPDPEKDYDSLRRIDDLLTQEKSINFKGDYDTPLDSVENNENKTDKLSNENNKDKSELSKMLEEENKNKEYPKHTM